MPRKSKTQSIDDALHKAREAAREAAKELKRLERLKRKAAREAAKQRRSTPEQIAAKKKARRDYQRAYRKRRKNWSDTYLAMRSGLEVAREWLEREDGEKAAFTVKIAANKDGTIDGELRANMTMRDSQSATDVILGVEKHLTVPSACWLSVAFVVSYRPRKGEEKRKRKKDSPKWRRVRLNESGYIDLETKVHWQRWNMKASHFVTAREMIRSIFRVRQTAKLTRIRVRICFSPERPSRSR